MALDPNHPREAGVASNDPRRAQEARNRRTPPRKAGLNMGAQNVANRAERHRIVLEHPAHGRFEVDPQVLTRAVAQLGAASVVYVRDQAAGACGYDVGMFGITTALDDCSLVEALIIWVESGNHTF